MKRLLVICFILIMCFSFVLANGTTNNATDKTATIPVNVTVLPYSTIEITSPATMFNFTLDPTGYATSGQENHGGFISNDVIIRIRSNHNIKAEFEYKHHYEDWPSEDQDKPVLDYFELKISAFENNNNSKESSWAFREKYNNNPGTHRYPLNHGIGEKTYYMRMYIQNFNKDWWEIEAGETELGTITITLSAQ